MPVQKTTKPPRVTAKKSKELWTVALDCDSGIYVAFSPSVEPSLTKKINTGEWNAVATFLNQKMAEEYAQIKNIGCTADALEFCTLEHQLQEQRSQLKAEQQKELRRMIRDVRESTGRRCFGSCKSFDARPACRTCHNNRYLAWKLCVNITSLRNLHRLVSDCSQEQDE